MTDTMNNMTQSEMTVKELNALVQTNMDAAHVVEEALKGLTSPHLKEDAQKMLQEHLDAAQQLRSRVTMLGGVPAADEHATNELKESWQKIWQDGNEEAVLLALRSNERVAVDGFKVQMTKENFMQTMTEEGVREHQKALEMELRHFQTVTDRLRAMGVAVDNDEVMGAVRNAAEHVHAAINLGGTAVEAFIKWATTPSGK